MELWVRYCSRGTDGLENGWEGVYRLTSTDGINWSDKEELYHTVDTSWASVLSPSVIYDEGKYKIWFIYQRSCLKYYESADGRNWQYIKDISNNIATLGSYKMWHFDMIKTDKGYEFVCCYQINGKFDKNNYIGYSYSLDNEYFEPVIPVLSNGPKGSFDDLELYRPCLVKVNNKYRMYYGAQKNIRIWHIGLVEAPTMEVLYLLLKSNKSNLPSNESTDTVNSFDESTWTPGYYNDKGIFIESENNLVMHCSQFIAIDGIPKALSAPSIQYLRVAYFDENKRFISFDRGGSEGLNTTSPETVEGINIHPIGAYFVICANTADKSKINLSDWTVERVPLMGEMLPYKYLNWQSGQTLESENACNVAYSRYIPVTPGDTYYIYSPYRAKALVQCLFFDINKKYNFNGNISTSNPGTHAQTNKGQGAAIIVPEDSIYYMGFHVGAENVDMSGTTVEDVFVYRKK